MLVIVLVLSAFPVTAESCGPSGKQCIQGRATCETDRCVCDPAEHPLGDGAFACYPDNWAFAELRNDPQLMNFNFEKVDFPYPCRFLFTHVRQEMKNFKRKKIGMCEFMIHAYNSKHRGKFYNRGFDIALRLQYYNGDVREFSARKYGLAINGVNHYTEQGTVGAYLPDGPWGNDDINFFDLVNRVTVESFEDAPNNQLVIEVGVCGLYITFAPYDIFQRLSQSRIPGLSVGVNCDHYPIFLSTESVVATGYHFSPGGQKFGDIIVPGLSLRESVLDRAFRSVVEQNQPDVNNECNVGHEVFFSCVAPGLKSAALGSCLWMFLEPRFIRCVDGTNSAEIITNFFVDCVESFCMNTNTCKPIMDFITDMGCHRVPNIPLLKSFLQGDICT